MTTKHQIASSKAVIDIRHSEILVEIRTLENAMKADIRKQRNEAYASYDTAKLGIQELCQQNGGHKDDGGMFFGHCVHCGVELG